MRWVGDTGRKIVRPERLVVVVVVPQWARQGNRVGVNRLSWETTLAARACILRVWDRVGEIIAERKAVVIAMRTKRGVRVRGGEMRDNFCVMGVLAGTSNV
jgi:hypothetical protein